MLRREFLRFASRSLLNGSCPSTHSQLSREGLQETLSTSACLSSTFASHRLASAATVGGHRADGADRTGTLEGVQEDVSISPAASSSAASPSSPPSPPPLRFLSSERGAPRPPPARRLPVCFPDLTLTMMRLSPEQLQQVRETGWLREVVFRTTPNVTKLEIAAYLTSVYGMTVERVHTINYLGRRRLTIARKGKSLWWREDDYKKAYVIFSPPPGMEHLMQQGRRGREGSKPVVEQIREAARAPGWPRRKRLPSHQVLENALE